MDKDDKNSDHWRPLQAIEVVPKLHDDGSDSLVVEAANRRPDHFAGEGVYSPDDMVEFIWEAKGEFGNGCANRNEEQAPDTKREELCVFGERTFYWGWFRIFFD